MTARKSAAGVGVARSGGSYNTLAYGSRCAFEQINGGAREACGAGLASTILIGMQDVHLSKQRLMVVSLPQCAGGLPGPFGFGCFGFLLVLRGPLCRVVGIPLQARLVVPQPGEGRGLELVRLLHMLEAVLAVRPGATAWPALIPMEQAATGAAASDFLAARAAGADSVRVCGDPHRPTLGRGTDISAALAFAAGIGRAG